MMQNATIQAMNIPQHAIVICATARLSRGLQDAYQHNKTSQGLTQWQAPVILTLAQWLDGLLNEALLLGEINAFSLPKFTLNSVAEKLLWEEAIANVLQKTEVSALFDIASLAQSAIEANKLLIEWQLDDSALKNNAHSPFQTEETRQFSRWRHEFQRLCSQHNVLEVSSFLALQINVLDKAKLKLPTQIIFAGYDRFTPLEKRLLQTLSKLGIHTEVWQPGVESTSTSQVKLADSDTECRAVVAWAKNRLAKNPNAQLAIISPVLGNIRNQLSYLLDDTFHAETLYPGHYEAARCYDFSLGLPLTQYPIINSALSLLKLAIPHTDLTQPMYGALLQDVYFSDNAELDARAQLDARLRRKLGRTLNFEQLLKQASLAIARDLQLPQLVKHLTQIKLLSAAWARKQQPSAWGASFITLLEAANWSKTRAPSSHEYQTKQAWLNVLDEFAALDSLLGNINANEALQRLTQLTHSTMFQPEAKGETHIQLLGLLETVAVQLDAIWVLGMNDHHWPPAAKPNPLLPAPLQRCHGTPNASAQVQTDFAYLIHQRLIKSAAEVIFSWAGKDGDRELRASPVLVDIKVCNELVNHGVKTLAETLSQPATMQKLDDHIAPAVSAHEKVRGGSQLFKAQAICPAWAFYQYRLGAIALEDPTDGLDSLARGNLVHAALQCFWQSCLDLATLKAMSTHVLDDAIATAVVAGIDMFCKKQSIEIPAQIVALEKYRLQQLLITWLNLESERADFTVQACEKEISLDISGIAVRVVIDRIDMVVNGRNDGGLVIIDYKTGSTVETKSWADDRISEPQLPIYASIALHNENIVAVCFGKVRQDDCQFTGVAEMNDIVPKIKKLDSLAKNSNFKRFTGWDELITHWQTSLNAIAQEIKNGEAAVKFKDENALTYCEVKPLLRLLERLLQFEQLQPGTLDTTQ